ncbi:hypothetical protein [Nonomuraea sp. SYSU D8015]|uniref:hypothetical protein n=1 Tax=Nonomuraea sp. SYSU D8015 TaxID=2593644 RepID=UPI001660FF3A|nr:hypothetical protein [Nonomuraea sp. SYSU D8015]
MVAGKIQYKDAQVAVFEGHAGTSASSSPGEARFLLGRTPERADRLEEALPHLPMATAVHAEPDYLGSVGRVEREPAA